MSRGSRAHALALPFLAAVLTVLACALVCGCGEHLVGTNDVAIAYAYDGGAATPDLVAQEIQSRLGAAQITADVEAKTASGASANADARDLVVTLDRGSADEAAVLIAWRGGLTVHDLAPDAALEKEGTIEDVAASMRAVKLAKGQKLLLEYLPDGRARSVMVKEPARVDLSNALANVTSQGGNLLLVRLTSEGATKLAEAAKNLAGAHVAIARDRTALAVGPLGASVVSCGPRCGEAADVPSELRLPFGGDLYSFARAHATSRLLATPALPSLARLRVEAQPVDLPLAIACVVLPLLVSIVWLFFVRQFDRAQPEPLWLVFATFALGGLSVIPAGLAEYGLMRASPYLNPSLMTLGGQVVAFPLALIVFTLVVGFSEETSKLLGAWTLAFHRREFDEPVDGIVYGAASALGFAAVENIKYFAVGRMSPVLIVVRTFTSVPAHLFFGAIWGWALGQKLVSKRMSVLLALVGAAIVHGLFDTLLSIDGLAIFAMLLDLTLAVLFIALLRSALRHGVVSPARAAVVRADRRSLFRLGSPGAFLASAVGLLALVAVIFIAGVYMETEHRRVGLVFVGVMSWLLVLLGFTAFGLTRTMPLDVVLDDYGVTFAGATRAWPTIRRAEIGQRGILLRTTEGDLHLGPGSQRAVGELARALHACLTPKF